VKKIKCSRIPFSMYMPESRLTAPMRKADRIQKEIDNGMRPPEIDEQTEE